MARILITGGAGFIGTHLAERLAATNDVVILDNFRRNSLSTATGLRVGENVRVATGDILDPAAVAGALDGVETVIHLAAIAGVTSYYEQPLRTLQVNLFGTANVLERAIERGVRSFVYFSTSEVYGPEALWVGEESGFHIGPVSDRRWVYATSKLAGEQLCLRQAEEVGFRATVLRPFNIYGPRQTGEGAVSNFCAAAAAGRPLKIYGDGSAIRAWCYISDLVDATAAALQVPEAAGQAFNIGNPNEVETTLGLARRMIRLAPGPAIEFESRPRAEVRARIPSIERAQRVLGFRPRVDLDEGLRATLAWFREGAGR